MTKAYSYIRMSTREQLKGDSSRRQLAAMQDYVARNSLELCDIFNDHGVSAYTGQNAEFGELRRFLDAIDAGQVERGSVLIVESLDRISRQNIFQAISLLEKIIQRGVRIVTLSDQHEYFRESVDNNPMELMMAALTLMRAHEESKTKSFRLSAAWSNKRAVARSGKTTNQRLPAWLQFSLDGKEIVPIADRTEIIREIFRLSLEGWGSYSIAKRLNERQLPTWGRAAFWQESYVKKLLANRSVLGEYQPHKLSRSATGARRIPEGLPVKDYYPQVIDPVTFSEAQEAAVRRRSGRGRKGKEFTNLFSGLLRCLFCDSGMRFVDKGPLPKGGKYLVCSKALLTRECHAPYFRFSTTEAHLWGILKGVNFEDIMNGPEWKAATTKLRTELHRLTETKSEIEQQRDNIVTAISNAGPVPSLLNRLNNFEDEIREIYLSVQRIEEELSQLAESSSLTHNDLLVRLEDHDLDAEQRHMLRRRIANEIRKLVKYIKIGRSFHMPTFVDESSYELFEPSDKLIDNIHDPNANLEVYVIYKNHSFSYLDVALGEIVHHEMGNRLEMFKTKKDIKDLC